jgi:DNA polymerase III alpha subunit
MRLEDETGSVKCVMWPEVFSRHSAVMADDIPVLLTGKLELTDDGAASIIVDQVEKLSDVLQRKACDCYLVYVARLKPFSYRRPFRVLGAHKGECDVYIELALESGLIVRTKPHGSLRIKGSIEIESILQTHGCRVEWLNAARLH